MKTLWLLTLLSTVAAVVVGRLYYELLLWDALAPGRERLK